MSCKDEVHTKNVKTIKCNTYGLYRNLKINSHICDKIKGNKSDVTNIIIEKLAKKEFNYFWFILFSALIKWIITRKPDFL